MRKSLFIAFCFLLPVLLMAQQHIVTGKVRTTNGTPIQGITVTVKGTNNATQTDDRGNFTINAPVGSTLVLSYLGREQQAKVGSGNDITLTFDESQQAQQLTEVVVTALGQTR